MTLNKSTVEDATLTWFGDLGYGVARAAWRWWAACETPGSD
jgi:hypothetical protein